MEHPICNDASKHPVSLNAEQAAGLIIERSKQLVNQLIEHRGHDRPPFLPEEFARLLGIKQIVRTNLGNTSGMLLRFPDGDIIKVSEKDYPSRQNFSCAHEIGHNLLRSLKIQLSSENVEFRTSDAYSKEVAKVRERLCDIAATELLMPEAVFRKYLTGFGASIHSVERLANTFKVSIQSAFMRIAEVSLEPCVALMWRPLPRTKPKALRLAWHVGPGRQSIVKANYVPTHTIAKSTSSLFKAYQYDSPIKSMKIIKINKATKRCPIESKGFGRDENRYVISLAYPDR